MKKILSATLAFVLIATLFAGCGSSSFTQAQNSKAVAPAASAAPPMAGNAPIADRAAGFVRDEMEMDEEVDYEPEEADDAASVSPPETGGGIAGPQVNPVVDSRKIIKNVNMELQTLTFDQAVDGVTKIAESFGGFVQDSYVQGRDMYNERGARSANFTVRIPSEKLDSFVNSFGGDEFNVISKSQNSQDITERYFDSKARLDALKVQEERLLSMMEKAEELEYLLKIEQELMNVRYEIESLTSSLNRMDSYVSLSTVNIQLYEVVKYEPVENVPVTFGERISRAFSGSWISFSDFSQDFTVALISVLPFLLLLAIIALIITAIIRKASKKKDKKPQYQPSAYMPPQYIPPSSPNDGPPQNENKK